MLVLAKIAMSLVRAKSRPDQLIESPTLVITGGADRMLPSHCSEILVEKIPKAKLIEVQGGSHAFFIEMRGRFNREVLGFLKDESVTPIASGCS
jgi:pimeloyl-ACP methyl ester carboxylesterase